MKRGKPTWKEWKKKCQIVNIEPTNISSQILNGTTERYWVERTLDDTKNERAMSDYQIRKWNGWYHHSALVFMASLFLLQQKITNEQKASLMSVRNARILVLVSLFGTEEDITLRLMQMEIRYRKRQKDIDK